MSVTASDRLARISASLRPRANRRVRQGVNSESHDPRLAGSAATARRGNVETHQCKTYSSKPVTQENVSTTQQVGLQDVNIAIGPLR